MNLSLRCAAVLLAVGCGTLAEPPAPALAEAPAEARADAPPPAELAPILAACRDLTALYAVVGVTKGEWDGTPLIVQASPEWLLVDVVQGTRPRYALRDGDLTVHDLSDEAPPAAADEQTATFARDFWAACRAGFADTEWTARSPYADGYQHNFNTLAWARGPLPGGWAPAGDLYLGMNRKSGALTEVVWRFRGEWGRARVSELDLTAAPPSFERAAPDPGPPIPKGFERGCRR